MQCIFYVQLLFLQLRRAVTRGHKTSSAGIFAQQSVLFYLITVYVYYLYAFTIFPRIPFINDADFSVLNFFAMFTASFMETDTGIFSI